MNGHRSEAALSPRPLSQGPVVTRWTACRRVDLFEKRRELMGAWARYCDNLLGDNVVSMVTNEARRSRA
jgi:hypothetical protein